MKEQDKGQEPRLTGLTGRVADTFVISGRPGVIAIPAEAWAVPVKVGDTLRLVKPDGSCLVVRLGGIEMVNTRGLEMMSRPKFDKAALLLRGENLSKEDVPIGTEIWID